MSDSMKMPKVENEAPISAQESETEDPLAMEFKERENEIEALLKEKANPDELSKEDKLRRLEKLEMEINRLMAEKYECEQATDYPAQLTSKFIKTADNAIEELKNELEELMQTMPELLEEGGSQVSGSLLNEETEKAFREQLMEEQQEFEEFMNERPDNYDDISYAEKAQRHYAIQTFMEKIEELANERISQENMPNHFQEMISKQATAQLSMLTNELEELTNSENLKDGEEYDLQWQDELEEDQLNFEKFRDSRRQPEEMTQDEITQRESELDDVIKDLEDFVNGSESPTNEKELTILRIKQDRIPELQDEKNDLKEYKEKKNTICLQRIQQEKKLLLLQYQ